MSIHSRLAALQAENTSLSEAADEAASLAETLASNNSELRIQLSSLSDSISRKDRQISRLSSQVHDSEATILSLNHRIDDLSSQLDELRQLASIADEIEVVLRRTVQTLQKRLVSAESISPVASHQAQIPNQFESKDTDTSLSNSTLVAAFRTHTDILSLPSSSPSMTAVHFALANSSAVVALALFALTSHPSRSPNTDPLSNSLASATVVGNAAATFLLSDPALAIQRTRQLSESLILLRDRVSSIAQFRSSSKFSSPPISDSSADVTGGLLQMAVSAVSSIMPAAVTMDNRVPKSPFALDGGLTPEAQVSLKEIARLNVSATEYAPTEKTIKPDPQISRLKQALIRRERELDDLRVRHAAFEQSVRVAVSEAARASADADALRAQLIASESTPAPDIGLSSEIPSKSNLPCGTEELDGFSLSPQAGPFVTPVRAFPPSHSPSFLMSARRSYIDGDFTGTTPRCVQTSGVTPGTGSIARLAQEQLRRLRMMYAMSAVESLLSGASENVHFPGEPDTKLGTLKYTPQDETRNHIYHVLKTTHSSGRRAAACARVAQLDKQTLMPMSRGATLSLRRPLEAIAYSRRINLLFSQFTLVNETRQKKNKDTELDATVSVNHIDELARTIGLQAG